MPAACAGRRSDIAGPADRRLLAAAREAALAAYAPYSRFRVGAAVLAGGEIYRGCNVENAAYGEAICAERNAVLHAVAAGARSIEAVALACIDAAPGSPSALMPCGSCLQVIAEFAGPETPVHVDGIGGLRLAELLPRPFRFR